MAPFQEPVDWSFLPPATENTISWDDYELYSHDADFASDSAAQLPQVGHPAKHSSDYGHDFAQYAPWVEDAVAAYQVGFPYFATSICLPAPASDQASSPWSADLSSMSGSESPRMEYGCYPSPPFSYDHDVPSAPCTEDGFLAEGSGQSVALCQVQQYPDLDFGVKLDPEIMHVSSRVCPPGAPTQQQYEGLRAVSDLSGNNTTKPTSNPKIPLSPRRPTPTRRVKSGNSTANRINKRQAANRGVKCSPRSSLSDKNGPVRIFTCSFSHYGCNSTFNSKNEWKRHVASQHLQLGFYRCDIGSCNVNVAPRPRTSRFGGEPNANGRVANDFNRKDLFTQHQRRMHAPWQRRGHRPPTEEEKAAFEHSLEGVRARCWIQARCPPMRSVCGFCGKEFRGPQSWDERMEHVGRHFEKDKMPVGAEMEDGELTRWAAEEGIVKSTGGRWMLSSLSDG